MSIADNWEDGEIFKELAELKVENALLRQDKEQLLKDKERLDWLADVNNTIGNVSLPHECVVNNIHSLRDAIDEAMGGTEL